MDYIVIAWYYSAQLVYGEVEYILNQYYSYLHRVLARNMIQNVGHLVDFEQNTF